MIQEKRDRWWLAQFGRLLADEFSGTAPSSLASRWLLLASRTWGDRRWSVTFDLPPIIHHVLDDADVRTKDARYARHQWAAAREWLNA